jgi:hypothetical protein
VLVSKVDIPARTQLDPLIAAGNFTPRCVGNGFVVAGAVTDVRELQGQRTYAQIYANEQIPLSRLLAGIP